MITGLRQSIFIGLLICAAAMAGHAQEGARDPLILPLPQGGYVGFRLRITSSDTAPGKRQPGPAAQLSVAPQVLADEGNIVHRLLVDERGSFVFGYDLLVEPLSPTRQFKVSARPLDAGFEERLRARRGLAGTAARKTITVATLLQATEIQVVGEGDTFALDLMVNNQTGTKVMDYVKVAFDRGQFWPSPVSRPVPHDFTLANVELTVRDFALRVDGRPLDLVSARHDCSGSLIWFYLPGHGRFIFSLVPYPGYDFRKIGVIEENKIAFTWGDARYEWISTEPIVGNGGTWNLWVLRDPNYLDFLRPPSPSNSGDKSRLADILLYPVRVARERIGDKRQSAFERKALSMSKGAERVRVPIGASDEIETLLPRP